MSPKYVTVFDCKNEINEIRNEETISQQPVNYSYSSSHSVNRDMNKKI